MRRFRTAVLIASSAALAFGVSAVPANAGTTFQYYSLNSSSTQLKTSTGKVINLEIFAYKSSGGGNASFQLTMRTGSGGHGESHLWSFNNSTINFNYNNGSGTLDTGNLPMNFGSVNLSFDKDSQHTTNCPDSGTVTAVRGTLKGSVNFDSKSDSWGRAHDNTFNFAMPNFVNVYDNCTGEPNIKPTCSKSISWSAPYQADSASANGFTVIANGHKHTTITGSRLTYLDNSYSVFRSDVVSDVGRTPLIDGSKLTVRTKKGTRVSGKAVLSGGSSSKSSHSCRDGSQTATEHTVNHTGAKWNSPHGIKFNQSAFNDFKTLLTGDNASWSKQNFS